MAIHSQTPVTIGTPGNQTYYDLGAAGQAFTIEVPPNHYDILVFKIDDAGVWQWWQNAGSGSEDDIAQIVAMADDSVTILGTYGKRRTGPGGVAGGATGYFNMFAPTFSVTPSSVDGNTFIANINSSGFWTWVNSGINGNPSSWSTSFYVSLSCITKLSNEDMVVSIRGNGESYGSVTTAAGQSAVMRITDTGDWP
jgi:hypothetical protein